MLDKTLGTVAMIEVTTKRLDCAKARYYKTEEKEEEETKAKELEEKN